MRGRRKTHTHTHTGRGKLDIYSQIKAMRMMKNICACDGIVTQTENSIRKTYAFLYRYRFVQDVCLRKINASAHKPVLKS